MSRDLNDIPGYFLNPDYGKGVFRRRILLRQVDDGVHGLLEDCSHGFEVLVRHDGRQVTAVTGTAHRHPLTTCPGAIEPLQGLVGVRLDTAPSEITRQVDPRANCTHWYDLALLCIGHAGRAAPTRQYDVAIPDLVDGRNPARVFRDGQLVHDWEANGSSVVAPEELAGNSLFHGFAAWANVRFSGDEQEAAFVLHKGYFVSLARLYDHTATEGLPAGGFNMPLGVCHSYSAEHIKHARMTQNRTRDFTDCEEKLLTFS